MLAAVLVAGCNGSNTHNSDRTASSEHASDVGTVEDEPPGAESSGLPGQIASNAAPGSASAHGVTTAAPGAVDSPSSPATTEQGARSTVTNAATDASDVGAESQPNETDAMPPKPGAGFGCAEPLSYGNPFDGAGSLEQVSVPVPQGSSPNSQMADGIAWVGSLGLLFLARVNASGELWQLDPNLPEPVFFSYDGGSKGITLDAQGRLLIAQEHLGLITRLDLGASSEPETVVELPFQVLPNDVIARSDGSLYITSTEGGLLHLDPHASLSAVETGVTSANGVALSLDENTLYFSSTREQRVVRVSLGANGAVDVTSLAEVLFTEGTNTNGFSLDCAGNLYVTSSAGVEVFDPAGQALGTIPLSSRGVNVAFGGAERRTLYIASERGLFAILLGVPGFPG